MFENKKSMPTPPPRLNFKPDKTVSPPDSRDDKMRVQEKATFPDKINPERPA